MKRSLPETKLSMSTFHPTRFSLGRACSFESHFSRSRGQILVCPWQTWPETASWRAASDWNQWQAKKNDWGRCEQCHQTPHTTLLALNRSCAKNTRREESKTSKTNWVAFTRLSMKDSWDRKMTGRSGLCFLLVEAWKQDLIRIDLFRAVPHNEVMANQKVKWVPREAIIQLWESDTKIGREPTDGTLKKGSLTPKFHTRQWSIKGIINRLAL